MSPCLGVILKTDEAVCDRAGRNEFERPRRRMTELFATLIALTLSGAAYGMVLYLVASGLSLLIGLTRIPHLGHAAFALIGGATASYLHTALGLTFINSTVLGMFAAMAVALVAERAMIRQLDRRAPMQHVAASLGLAFLTIAVVSLLCNAPPVARPVGDAFVGLGRRLIPVIRRGPAACRRGHQLPPAA